MLGGWELGVGSSRSVTIYGIRHCDTMKKARAWLDARGVAHTFHDYAAAGITRSAEAYVARWRQFAAGLKRID